MADTSRSWARQPRGTIGALLIGLVAGCGPRTTDEQQLTVAFLGEERLTRSDLEAYFEANLVETDDEVEPREQAAVRSRLFDAFIEERLLLAEAERRAVSVDEREVTLYLGGLVEDTEGDEAERKRLELEARRRLMIEKLRERALLAVPAPKDEEIRAHAARFRDRLAPERGLELRALMLESMERAERVYREIRRRRITFAEAVVRYEKTPGQGLPMRVAWDGLSTEVRAALEDLKSGQISRPMEVNGNVYIFKVESWLKSREEAADELIRRARAELESQRRQEALDVLLREIRERTPIRLELRNLPFDYVPEATG